MLASCPLLSTINCTVETCPLSCAQMDYRPSLAGNAVYATIFVILLLAQLVMGTKSKTWGFMIGMVCGLVLEVVGYAGRVMLHNNPFDFNNFIIYLVPITIGPAFLAGALYLCISRIVIVHGQQISALSPRTYAITFMTSDFVSLVLQGAGGGLAATASDRAGADAGRAIMLAGVIFQVVSLFIFICLWLWFIARLRTTLENGKNKYFEELRSTKRFLYFQYSLGAAVVLIFIRSIYRVAELQQGFNGPIANDEVSFMILEGPMIFLAVLAVTVLHPSIGFDGEWSSAAWSIKSSGKTGSDTGNYSMDYVQMHQ